MTFTFCPLQSYVDASIARERLAAMLSSVFGVLGLLLAGLGLYGVTSYAVNRRRSEIGIRLALVTTPASIVRHVLARVSFLVGAGVIAGIVASLWLSTFVATLLYGLEPRDPNHHHSATIVLAAVGVAAAWLPILRASAINPAQVLRNN
jgi:ABC-type antimicrobial peptide transport system permease subunit